MEIKLLALAIERLHDKVETLSSQLETLKQEVAILKEQPASKLPEPVITYETSPVNDFMTIKEVREMLGIAYVTLMKVVAQGYLTPIKINQRTVRYSRKEVLKYMYRNHK